MIAFSVVATMTVLVGVLLLAGKRQMADLTPVDFALSITAGTVAGAGIADPRLGLGHTLAALMLLGVTQIIFSWATLRYRGVYTRLNFAPTVVVEDGQIIKANLRRTRLTAEMLLQLLRDKDVFDITEVELAILEPSGKLSVLKKAEYLPVTASRLGQEAAPNRVLVPVVLEGKLQEETLAKLGFSAGQIAAFHNQYGEQLKDVFVALMDRTGQVHVIREDVAENGSFLH
jgi:Predicted membrane protein